MSKNIELKPVLTKAHKRWGIEYPAQVTEFSVEIVPNESVSIFRNGIYKNTFSVGELCEYSSYNWSYLGTILKISEKTVQILEEHSTKVHHLNINEFCWRNESFNLEKALDEKHDAMMYV